MRIIVAGGGNVGEQVARSLGASGNEVVVVEADGARVSALAAGGLHVVPGNACSAEPLEAAGALGADVLVACTGQDEENLVISLLARQRLEIPRVVARVNDDANRWLFDETWGVDAAISSAFALVALIEEATGSAQTVRLADLAAVALVLVEANVTAGSTARGRRPSDLSLGDRDLVAAVVRHGRAVPVTDDLRFRPGDRALVVTDPEGEARIRRAFYQEGG